MIAIANAYSDMTTCTSTGYYTTTACNTYYQKLEPEEHEFEEDEWWLYNWRIIFIVKVIILRFIVECRCRSPTYEKVKTELQYKHLKQ